MRVYKSIYLLIFFLFFPLSVLVFFLFFSPSANAANRYVDGALTTGGNNGTSWANAWQSFADINWGSINPGDIIYVSGGADSAMYYEQLNILDVHGTAANWITVKNSYEAGHNGRVIIDGDDYTIGNGIVFGTGPSNTSSYIYIKGFEIRHHGTSGYAGITIRYPNNCITIDSCLIYNNRRNGIHLFGTSPAGRNNPAQCTDSVTIKNCFIMSSLSDPNSGQEDLIQADAVTNTVIDNNVFHIRRPVYENAAHNDGIQALGTMGWRITNNFFIMDSAAYTQANILSAYDYIDAKMDSVIYYNNVFFDGGTWASPRGTGEGTAFFMKREFSAPTGTRPAPVVAIHNTIVTYGPNYSPIEMQYERTVDYFKNNIVAQFGNGRDSKQSKNYQPIFNNAVSPDTILFENWRGNLWYRERKTEWDHNMFSSGNYYGNGRFGTSSMRSVAEMNNLYGTSDIEANPVFSHDFSYRKHLQAFIDAYTMEVWKTGVKPQFWMPQSDSPLRNAGENLQSVVEGMGLEWKDINGNPRDSSPTIGAYE